MTLRPFALLAALAAAPSASAQCLGDLWPAPLDSVPSTVVFQAAALGPDRTYLASNRGSGSIQTPMPAIVVARHDPSTGAYGFEARLSPSSWDQRGGIACVDVQGDTLIAQRVESFFPPNSVDVFERGAGGWAYTEVPLAGMGDAPWLRLGQRCAISGDTILVADGTHTPATWSQFDDPFEVMALERGPQGAWAQVQRLVLPGTRTGWWEYPVTLALDRDVAAVAKAAMTPVDAVLVMERGSAGQWSHTATLPPPSPVDHHLLEGNHRVAVSGDLVACQRYREQTTGELRTTIHRRVAPGTWVPVQTIVTADPDIAATDARMLDGGVLFDGDVLALSCGGVVDLHRLTPAGTFVPERRITGLGVLADVDGEAVIGLERAITPGGARAVPRSVRRAGPGVLPRNQWCQGRGDVVCGGANALGLAWLQQDPGAAGLFARAEVSGAAPGATCAAFVSGSTDLRPTAAGDICLGGASLRTVGAPAAADALGRAGFQVDAPALAPFAGLTLYAQAVAFGPAGTALSGAVGVAQ